MGDRPRVEWWSQQKKPNIVVIWGDDIGRSNLSTYTEAMMGYHTPNIGRIAREGVKFTELSTCERNLAYGDLPTIILAH